MLSDKVTHEGGTVLVEFEKPCSFSVEWDDWRMPPNGDFIIEDAIKASGKKESDFEYAVLIVTKVELVPRNYIEGLDGQLEVSDE